MVAVAVPRELFEHRRQVVKGDDARDQRRDVDGARDDQVACLLELGRVTKVPAIECSWRSRFSRLTEYGCSNAPATTMRPPRRVDARQSSMVAAMPTHSIARSQ